MLLAEQFAQGERGNRVFFDGLCVVIEDDIRNARFIELFDRFAQAFIVPDAQNHQIGIGGDNFLDRESAVFGIANIGNILQLRQRFFIACILLRPPVFPGGKRERDHFIHRVLAANGEVILVIKTEHNALRHFGYGHGTTDDVRRGNFGKGRNGGRERQRGSKQQLFHVNLLNVRGNSARKGLADYKVTRV